MGNVIARHRDRLLQPSNKALSLTLTGLLLATVGEHLLAAKLGWAYGGIYSIFLYPLMLTLFVLLLKNPLSQRSKAGAYCGAAATFVYFAHPLVLDNMRATGSPALLNFAVAVAVCTAIACVLKKWNKPWVNDWLL